MLYEGMFVGGWGLVARRQTNVYLFDFIVGGVRGPQTKTVQKMEYRFVGRLVARPTKSL